MYQLAMSKEGKSRVTTDFCQKMKPSVVSIIQKLDFGQLSVSKFEPNLILG